MRVVLRQILLFLFPWLFDEPPREKSSRPERPVKSFQADVVLFGKPATVTIVGRQGLRLIVSGNLEDGKNYNGTIGQGNFHDSDEFWRHWKAWGGTAEEFSWESDGREFTIE